jgi:hypothetical protein
VPVVTFSYPPLFQTSSMVLAYSPILLVLIRLLAVDSAKSFPFSLFSLFCRRSSFPSTCTTLLDCLRTGQTVWELVVDSANPPFESPSLLPMDFATSDSSLGSLSLSHFSLDYAHSNSHDTKRCFTTTAESQDTARARARCVLLRLSKCHFGPTSNSSRKAALNTTRAKRELSID